MVELPLLNFDAPSQTTHTGVVEADESTAVEDYAGARNDGWYSAITGIGTATNDKRLSHTFRSTRMTYQQLIETWRGDGMAARAIEKPPAQCFRQGYEIEISDEGRYENLKVELQEAMIDLDTDNHVERCMVVERALGGAALWLGVDDNRPLTSKMDPARVRGIDFLKVLEPIELAPFKLYEDPNKPKYGEVELYQLTEMHTAHNGLVVSAPASMSPRLIHETRLIIFPGVRVSNYRQNANEMSPMWGDSILVRMMETLRDFNIAWHAAGIIATDFSQAVISIENLMGLVARDQEKLRLRMEAMELGRSVARAVLLDTREKYERQTTNIAGLPDLLEKLSRRLAADIDMPLSILMGAGEMGIGKDGLSDVRHWYDGIAAMQRRRVAPVLRKIAKLQMGTLRKRGIPPHWGIKFHPLWQLTDQEKADAYLTMARADALNVKTRMLAPNEARDSRFRNGYSFDTQIDESQKSPTMAEVVEMDKKAADAAVAKANTTTVAAHSRGNPTKNASPDERKTKEGGDVTGSGSNTKD